MLTKTNKLPSLLQPDKMQQTQYLSIILLVVSWFFLPLVIWLSLAGVFAFGASQGKQNGILILLIIFSFSFLISSRYIGYLWEGSDDMPSYLMAYQHYDTFAQIMPVSLIYGKHADFLFALYSWFIATISEHHLFFYYFLTLFITYSLIWKFCKIANTPNPLLCFILVVIFYKFFQGQWHLIRSYLALPILLSGLLIARINFKRGSLIFLTGALVHVSMFMLLLPIFVLGERINKKWGVLKVASMLLLMVLGILLLFVSIKFLSHFSGHYFMSKILSRLQFSPGFSKLPVFLFFIFINLLSIPAYIRTTNVYFIRIFNITTFLSLLNFIAIFIIGDELHRILVPFYLLYSPLIVFLVKYYKPKFIIVIATFMLLIFHVLAFSYVLYINQSHFFYLDHNSKHPIDYIGWEYMAKFYEYMDKDIQYYDGYRKN